VSAARLGTNSISATPPTGRFESLLLPGAAVQRTTAPVHLELVRSQHLQSEVWAQAVAANRMSESRPGTELLVVPALNQMFDIATVRVVATQIHPPLIVYGMLIALALASALFAGYQSAGEKVLRFEKESSIRLSYARAIYRTTPPR